MTRRTLMIVKIRCWVPEEIKNKQDIATYIIDALQNWGGQMPPEELLFDSLSIEDIKTGNVRYLNLDPRE